MCVCVFYICIMRFTNEPEPPLETDVCLQDVHPSLSGAISPLTTLVGSVFPKRRSEEYRL